MIRLMIIAISIYFTSIAPNLIYAQSWPHVYDTTTFSWVHCLIEQYDRGYLIVGQVDPGFGGVDQTHTWLLKTDINGNLIWNKRIYNQDYIIGGNDIYQTMDGGVILIGSTSKYDPGEYDIMFIKFNACGEKEWCTILSTPGNSDYGVKVVPVSDGYIGLLNYYQDWVNKRVWTIKLDLTGNVVWRKVYLQVDTGYRNEEACNILSTPDHGFLVTADGYYDPTGGWNGYMYSILIKTDSLGNEQWITRWGEESNYYSLLPVSPSLSGSGNYFSANTHYKSLPFPGYVPAFIKTSPTGQELFSADLLTDTEAGITTKLHFLYPDTIITAIGWKKPLENYKQGVAKSDTNGNLITTKVLLDSVINTFMGAALTFDKKYILAGGFSIGRPNNCIYLFKINSNLDLDSLYTAPRTYDSLCPYQIVSDTLDLENCDLYTALTNPDTSPESYQLTAYPVPSVDIINLELPEELLVLKPMNGVKVQTIYHQWDKTTLQVYNLQGHLTYEETIPFSKKEVKIDCSNWHQGMYLVRLIYNNAIVGGVKVVVK